MKRCLAVIAVAAFLMNGSAVAFAAEGTDYAAEIKAMKTRIAELESKMQAADKKKPAKAGEDKVKFGGDFRVRYVNSDSYSFEQRVRLNLKYKVSDDIDFNARWVVMKDNQMGLTSNYNNQLPNTSNDPNLEATDLNTISDAYVTVKRFLGGDGSFVLGRFGQDIGATRFWNSSGTFGMIDGFKYNTSFGAVKTTIGYANWSPLAKTTATGGTTGKWTNIQDRALQNAYFITTQGPVGHSTDLYGVWLTETSSSNGTKDYYIRGLGVKTKLNPELTFVADYLRNYAKPDNPKGIYASLRLGDADDQRPHSFEMRFDYHNIEKGNVPYTASTGVSLQPSGDIKGPGFSLHYCPAKNSLLELFQSFNASKNSTGARLPSYTRLQYVIGFD